MSRRKAADRSCKALFITFLKIGAFTFGGGYAMIPLIKREIVEEKEWLKEEEMFDIIAIAESTPGPMAINSATFVGTRIAGFKGALAATVGVVLPSFLVILIISGILSQIEHLSIVQDAFRGIRAGVLVLIGSAFISLFRHLKKDWFTVAVLILAFAMIMVFHVNSIIILAVCAFCGTAWSWYLGKRVKQ